jgi:hypothetical protein
MHQQGGTQWVSKFDTEGNEVVRTPLQASHTKRRVSCARNERDGTPGVRVFF